MSSSAAHTGITITRTTMPTIPAHPTPLRQVLANLIGNAVKYVAPDTDPHVQVSATSDEKEVTVSITDNGIGIPVEACDKVFALFHRETTRERYKRTGVGLTTC